MRYCTRCGTALREGGAFCTACGAGVALGGPAVAPAGADAPVSAAPSKSLKHRGRRSIIALAVILLVVAGGTAVGYWLWSTPPVIDPAQVEMLVIP